MNGYCFHRTNPIFSMTVNSGLAYLVECSISVVDNTCAPQRILRGIICKYARQILEDTYLVVYWNVLQEVKKNIILI